MMGDINSTSSLNIAHIVLSMEIGGLERLVEQIVKKMRLDGNNVHLFCLEIQGVIGDELKNEGFNVESFNRKSGFLDISLLLKLLKRVKDENIDIIHSHNQESMFYSVLVKLLNPGIKIIHTQHGVEPPISFKKIIKQLFLCKFINKYVAVSDDVSSIAIKKYHVAKNKVSVILNGVDTNFYNNKVSSPKENLRDTLHISENDMVITCVARLAPIKNHAFIIDIANKLKGDIDNFKVLIIGDGPEREKISHMVQSNNLNDCVFMLGEKNNIKDYLNISDIFLLTSFSEGINVSLLEAMSMNVVPVTSNVGGNSEVITKGVDGVLVDDFDLSEFSSQLVKLIKDSDYFSKLKVNSRIKIINNFSFKKMINEYYRIYSG